MIPPDGYVISVAGAARQWALLNPVAWEKKPLTIPEVLNARMVSYPFTVRDICLVTENGHVDAPLGAASFTYYLGAKDNHTGRLKGQRRTGHRDVGSSSGHAPATAPACA